MFDVINDDNFFLYAAKDYDNPSCTGLDDFYEDLNHIKYIKRLFNRYENKGELKDGLITNHLLTLYNIFGDSTTTILFFKLEESYWPLLKTFLVGLNRMPDVVCGLEQGEVNTVDIPLNLEVVKRLRIRW